MRLILLAATLVASQLSHAAELVLPDICKDGLCFTDIHWKKGFLEHTLKGFVGPEAGRATAESVSIAFTYSDGTRNGSGSLNLRNVAPRTPFYFKVLSQYVSWDRSTINLTAGAIFGIEPMRKEGLICKFKSLGSRLSIDISNRQQNDLVLDYQLLTLSTDHRNLKLNGTGGRYSELSTPAAPALIAAGSEHETEFIPMGAASFEDGEWVEDWRLHATLLQERPTLTLPLDEKPGGHMEKIPLEVHSAQVTATASVPPKSSSAK